MSNEAEQALISLRSEGERLRTVPIGTARPRWSRVCACPAKHIRHPAVHSLALEYSFLSVDGGTDVTMAGFNRAMPEDAERVKSPSNTRAEKGLVDIDRKCSGASAWLSACREGEEGAARFAVSTRARSFRQTSPVTLRQMFHLARNSFYRLFVNSTSGRSLVSCYPSAPSQSAA